jgi:protein O-GlcNAc transferase
MNRAEKRRQEKLAKKAARKAKPDIATSPLRENQNQENTQALALGLQHHKEGRLPEAEKIYRQILQSEPTQPSALHLLGMIAFQMGKNDAAADLINSAITHKPDYAEAHSNLGMVNYELGHHDEAIGNFRQSIAIMPTHTEAHYNLGSVLKEIGKMDEALASFHQAIALKPDYADAYNNMGLVHQQRKKMDEALDCFHQAIAFNPDHAEAHNNLGIAYRRQKQLEKAVACFLKAVAIDPDFAQAYSNLGTVYKDQKRLGEAIASYRKAVDIKPDYASAHSNLILTLNYSTEITEADIFEESKAWNRKYATASDGTHGHNNDRNPNRRLRIGYVSPDMCSHSVGYFFEPLLAAHDHDGVETFCYSGVETPDATTQRLKNYADHWRETVFVDDVALAEMIRADGIDILVDMAGHTAGNRLPMFTMRPSPVQVTWLGYPNTTGLEAMDYRIVDALTDPNDEYASETLIRLPGGFICYQPPNISLPISPANESAAITFGSFNNVSKLTEPCIDLWSQILTTVPASRLFLKSHQFADNETQRMYREGFAERGVTGDSLELLGWQDSLESHLGLYAGVDVCLDPFPYNGTTTTCEALWMGVPVVTLRQGHHRGRVGTSLLSRAGLDECVADSPEDYIAIAAGLAEEYSRRADYRENLRNNMAPLCDADVFARDMEAAYRSMWVDWCETPPL